MKEKIKCQLCELEIEPGHEQSDPEKNKICEICLEEKFFTCEDCQELWRIDDKLTTDSGDSICQSCYDNDYITCEDCDNIFHTNDCRENDHGGYVCDTCFSNNYTICAHCDVVISNDNSVYCDDCQESYCQDCYDDDHQHENYGDVKERSVSSVFLQSATAKNMVHNRCVGVEIEVEKCSDRYSITYDLPQVVGVSEDGSLDESGIEMQTPPASGAKFEKVVKDTLKVISRYGCQATRSCGLHIHIDARDVRYNPTKLSKILRAYYAVEPLLYAMLPKSRYGSTFCKPLRQNYTYEDLITRGLDKLERIWYKEPDKDRRNQMKNSKYDEKGTRYTGLNLHSLFYRGSVEVRYHSGTTDWNKIRHWTILNLCIVEYAINHYQEKEIKALSLELQERAQASGLLGKIAKIIRIPNSTKKYIAERIGYFNTDRS